MPDLSAPPTLAEYVETNLAYQGDQQAVVWLINDVFCDVPALAHCFASGPPTGAANGDGIVSRESGYDTFSKNPGSPASGLTQQEYHQDVYYGFGLPYDPFNPLYNLRVARSLAGTPASLYSNWKPLPPACRGLQALAPMIEHGIAMTHQTPCDASVLCTCGDETPRCDSLEDALALHEEHVARSLTPVAR